MTRIRGRSKGHSVSGAHCLETQMSTIWPQGFTKVMADYLTQMLQGMGLSQMKSDPRDFTGCDSSSNANLIIMAYVDILVASGESSSMQRFFQETQRVVQAHRLPHDRSLSGVLGQNHQGLQVRSRHNGILIDNVLGLFDIRSRVTINGVKIPAISKEDQVKCDKNILSLYHTAMGKPNSEMTPSTLSQSFKFAVKSSGPDVESLKHLLRYVNQTRDNIFVMGGLSSTIPVQIGS